MVCALVEAVGDELKAVTQKEKVREITETLLGFAICMHAGFEYVTERNGVKIYRKPK